MNKLTFLKVFNSPFKRPKFKFYIGKIAIGVPYFYPSKWVKLTHEDIHEKVINQFNKLLIKQTSLDKDLKIPPYSELYNKYLDSKKRVPKKIGFDFVGLGWKTKWSDTDYRFEWSPLLSFVFFGLQIAIIIKADYIDQYWESWLFYENNTDKSLSKRERIQFCRDKFKQEWTQYQDGQSKVIDYYPLILKNRYI